MSNLINYFEENIGIEKIRFTNYWRSSGGKHYYTDEANFIKNNVAKLAVLDLIEFNLKEKIERMKKDYKIVKRTIANEELKNKEIRKCFYKLKKVKKIKDSIFSKDFALKIMEKSGYIVVISSKDLSNTDLSLSIQFNKNNALMIKAFIEEKELESIVKPKKDLITTARRL